MDDMYKEYLAFRLQKLFLNAPDDSHQKWVLRQELLTMDIRMGEV